VVEADYYEDTADWSLERHLESRDELRRFEVTAGLISPNAERLLDVGTGNGAFLSFLEMRSSPLDLWGLERSKAAIAASRCQAKIIEGSIDALPFQDRAFDTVTALEVIEHLPHAVYAKALAEIARVASMQVLISVPYRERRLMVACPECGCRFSPIFHLRTFDEDKLVNLVPGFHLTRCEYVSTDVRVRCGTSLPAPSASTPPVRSVATPCSHQGAALSLGRPHPAALRSEGSAPPFWRRFPR
jgi:hypothetical protein